MPMIAYYALFLMIALSPRPSASEIMSQDTLQSAFHWQDCASGHVHHPISTDEVADLVEVLHRDMMSNGRHYLVHASHNVFFSLNNVTGCADVGAAAMVIQLDLSRMNQVLRLDIDEGSVTVQSGITFEDLDEFLLGRGLSLQGLGIVSPPFSGMSLAAAINSAAHGSSLVGPASIAAGLRSAVLVDGLGHVLALDSPGDLLEGSLGLFGVITELTLGVTRARKLTVMQMQQEDALMLDELRLIIEESQAHSLDVTWSPAASVYTTRVWHEGDPGMEGDAVNTQMHAPQAWLDEVDVLLEADDADAHDRSNIMCQLIGDMTGFHTLVPYKNKVHAVQSGVLWEDDGESPSEPDLPPSDVELLVGWVNRLASPRCLSSDGRDCLRRHAKVTPHTISIASEDFATWVEDVKDVLGYSVACPNFLFHFRFVMASEAPLSMSAGMQSVSIDIQTVESLSHHRAASPSPTKHQDLLDEILQLTLCKYRGRPHWALSTNRMLFTSERCGSVVQKFGGELMGRFMERRLRYDPDDLFLNPAFVGIISEAEPERYPGCAAKEDCFCLEDSHCGQGYECGPASAFPEYNVCRPKQTGKDEL